MIYEKYADIGQKSLDYYYKNDDIIQYMNNLYPINSKKDNETFNYWWIAHLIDVRIDAYLRTEDEAMLAVAKEAYRVNKQRNHNTLRHEFYDDMLWNALAGVRLYDIEKNGEYLEDAKEVCDDIMRTAWNEHCGGGLAWKRTQLDYKNTPVNAPFIILAIRLYKITNESCYWEMALKVYDWIKRVLVRADSFVEDGINRLGDGKIDTQWQFTYNQGVYIGAVLEIFKVSGEEKYLEEAHRCAEQSLNILVQQGVLVDEGDGGDIGLFKGILYRYLCLLNEQDAKAKYSEFIMSSVDILVKNKLEEGYLLANRNWTTKNDGAVYLSDELSAVMAMEMAAKCECTIT